MFPRLCRKSRWTASVVATVGLCMAVGTAAADPASDASSTPKATGTRVTQSVAHTQSGAHAASTPSASPSSANSSTASSPTSPALKVICFQSSIRCFSAKSTASPATGTTPKVAALDLRAPELSQVFTQAQLAEKLQEPEEDQYEVTETVQVEGERQLAPVSVGLMAIPWAIIHPTQAWRILMPVPDAK
jgi:hypothetical protein